MLASPTLSVLTHYYDHQGGAKQKLVEKKRLKRRAACRNKIILILESYLGAYFSNPKDVQVVARWDQVTRAQEVVTLVSRCPDLSRLADEWGGDLLSATNVQRLFLTVGKLFLIQQQQEARAAIEAWVDSKTCTPRASAAVDSKTPTTAHASASEFATPRGILLGSNGMIASPGMAAPTPAESHPVAVPVSTKQPVALPPVSVCGKDSAIASARVESSAAVAVPRSEKATLNAGASVLLQPSRKEELRSHRQVIGQEDEGDEKEELEEEDGDVEHEDDVEDDEEKEAEVEDEISVEEEKKQVSSSQTNAHLVAEHSNKGWSRRTTMDAPTRQRWCDAIIEQKASEEATPDDDKGTTKGESTVGHFRFPAPGRGKKNKGDELLVILEGYTLPPPSPSSSAAAATTPIPPCRISKKNSLRPALAPA